MHPILPITVPVKKIKGAARQCYVVTLSVNRPLALRLQNGQDPLMAFRNPQVSHYQYRHNIIKLSWGL